MAAFTRREARRKFPMKGFGILGRDHVLHRHRRFPALSILRCEHTADFAQVLKFRRYNVDRHATSKKAHTCKQ